MTERPIFISAVIFLRGHPFSRSCSPQTVRKGNRTDGVIHHKLNWHNCTSHVSRGRHAQLSVMVLDDSIAPQPDPYVRIWKLNTSGNMADRETRRFASDQVDKRLERLAVEIREVVKSGDSDAVHDLRVAVRRFWQALSVFKLCFRGKALHNIRRQLKRIMSLAGEVRNCDLALKLLSKWTQLKRVGVRPKLHTRRRESEPISSIRRTPNRDDQTLPLNSVVNRKR